MNRLLCSKGVKLYPCLCIIAIFLFHPSLVRICNAQPAGDRDSLQTARNVGSSKYNAVDISFLGPFYFPIHGKVISHFGKRGLQFHPGTDIKLNHGDTVRAGFKGLVTRASRYYGYGNLVIIGHGHNLETYYAHLSKILVHTGDSISSGEPLGLGGRTGRATTDHLHFEIRVNHKPYNPELLFDFDHLRVISTMIELTPKIPLKEKQLAKYGATSSHEQFHTVVKKDTLYSLAVRYGTTVKAICTLNGIREDAILRIGEKLKIR